MDIAVAVHGAVVFRHAVLAAAVQNQCAGPVGHVPLGDAGRLKLQVGSLLPQVQKLPQPLVLLRCGLGALQLLPQLGILLPQGLVLRLQFLHAGKVVADAVHPVHHSRSGCAEGGRDNAQCVVEKAGAGAHGRDDAQYHGDHRRAAQQPDTCFGKKSLH